jgi:hypothetical protein
MKTRIITTLGVLITLWCVMTGCDLVVTPRDAQPAQSARAKAAVRVTVAADGENAAPSAAQNRGRTVVPANPGFVYTLTFSAGGTSVSETLDGNMGEVLLDPGTWTLSVTGKKDGAAVAESESVSVTAAEGMTSVTVTVHPILNGAAGTFRYAVSAAASLTGVSAALTPLEVGSAEKDAIPLITGSEQTAALAPGYYRLTVAASKGTQPLIRREVVHIYSSTETYKAYNLSEADFASAVYLAGTLSGGIGGYSPVAVIAFEDAACGIYIDESEVSGGAWGLAVEATSATVYCKVKLEKGGSGEYYSKPVSVSGFPVTGKTDIALAVAGYTVTFDAKGGTFESGGDSVTMTAPENGTLTPPSAPQSAYTFVDWHSVEERFTTETPITGDTMVYAKWLIPAGNIADYLNGQSGGTSPDDPVPLTVNLDFANSGWGSLITTIYNSGKYVSLDLSACTMNGTEFDLATNWLGREKITALVLPDTAKGTSSTFNGFTALRSLSGAEVEIVGDSAFEGCTSLASVNLPVATAIGDRAFRQTGLTAVNLPVAETIGEWAFGVCTNLTTVNLPKAADIGNNAFQGCTSLTEVSLPTAETIGRYAFYNCMGLTTANLPKAADIGDHAFFGCTSLASVNLPVAQTGEQTFRGCTSLTAVSLPAATDIGECTFYDCTSLTEVSLPTAETIGRYAFYNCTSLTTVSLPVAQTIDSYYAFSGCTSLTTISLPVMETIGSYAFDGCTSLTTVSLPAAQTINYGAFSGCASLTAVSLPVAQTIGGYAFHDCTSLTTMSLPVAEIINFEAFSGCTGLTAVNLPVVTTIEGSAFIGCPNLITITVDPANTAFTAHDGMLLNKAGTTLIAYPSVAGDITLPSVTAIGLSGFDSCANLTAANLPLAEAIGDYAFYECTSLTSVSLPVAETIGEWAFYGCTNLETVSLPVTPPSRGNAIFEQTGSSGAISVQVPAGAVSAYTSAWGVDANTPAGGNTGVYGENHKAILITDAQ